MAVPGRMETGTTLIDVIDRVLDKGLVINADITVSIAGVELLGIKIRAALASFETAAKYGLEFPSGTRINTDAWHNALQVKEECPKCGKRVSATDLLQLGCPWCGYKAYLLEHREDANRLPDSKGGRAPSRRGKMSPNANAGGGLPEHKD